MPSPGTMKTSRTFAAISNTYTPVTRQVVVRRYMTICKYITEAGTNGRQSCPDEDSYPWLGDNCGGSEPCSDCVP